MIAKDIDMVTAQSIIDYANTKRITNGKAEGDPDAKYETVLSMYKESSSTREYPNGMYLSSVLGFCDDSGNGMYGLENRMMRNWSVHRGAASAARTHGAMNWLTRKAIPTRLSTAIT